MTRKPNRTATPTEPRLGAVRWRTRIAMALVAVGVVASSVAIRTWMGSPSVNAGDLAAGQANNRSQPSSRPAGASSATPAAQRTAVPSAEAPIPETVAVVNQQRITRDALAKACLERFGEEVLESLVNKHLILQECNRRRIVVSPQDIDHEIEVTAQRFQMSPEIWLKMLRDERQINAKRYREDIVWPMLALRRLAADKIAVSPEQLQAAFESEYGEKVQVRMIATASASKAEQLHQQVTADPAQFGELAKDHSEDTNSAATRGLIPPIRRHLGEPAVEEAVFALPAGQVSPVVSVHGQYLIFKCERRIPATNVSLQERKAVEARLRQRITEENLRGAADTIFAELQQGAQVVNVFNDEQLRQQNPGVAAFVNEKPVPLRYLAEECLARYGNDVLEGEIRFVLLSQSLKQANQQVTKQDLQMELARIAEMNGYIDASTKQPDTERWLQAVTENDDVDVRHYMKDVIWPSSALRKLVATQVEITEEDLAKGFEANYGPRAEVLAIVLSNQRVAQEVWDMARKNPTRAYFGQLASQYSIEPVSRANLGEIPPIQRHSGQPALEEEAFTLQPGQISGIVAVQDTFVIMLGQGQTQPIVSDPNEVADMLAQELREKKTLLAMSDKYEELMARSQIDNFLAGTMQTPNRRDRSVAPAGINAAADGRARPASAARPISPR